MMAVEEMPIKDWYSILGADPSANVSDLKQKYQKLILMYHPDKQSTDVPAGTVEERVQKFIEIDQAWKILGNEETKREYDLQRCEDNLRSIGPVDAQVYLEEMSCNEGHIFNALYFNNDHEEPEGPIIKSSVVKLMMVTFS
ncbi:dnaJ homolog subfamily C member 24 isoform X4 [Aotus nancymaae]|uniref:dnaJ homolog subfamily C member 24 isoform X4 n=1 Tax=Aotus nancymaae TaxID=37293 RepID=UPI0006264135|nr:dnaJ homolog subfamily C member 24 isoform X2 [Aotus nancymaae]XP_012307693.1 dnaJ homolog subfamily C member 24 isoform X2 [Aotus nancymaae]XP_012307694.1 dnaJ homolog subfamily C member 24 isoform X2 [Aotus nancymaae]